MVARRFLIRHWKSAATVGNMIKIYNFVFVYHRLKVREITEMVGISKDHA